MYTSEGVQLQKEFLSSDLTCSDGFSSAGSVLEESGPGGSPHELAAHSIPRNSGMPQRFHIFWDKKKLAVLIYKIRKLLKGKV